MDALEHWDSLTTYCDDFSQTILLIKLIAAFFPTKKCLEIMFLRTSKNTQIKSRTFKGIWVQCSNSRTFEHPSYLSMTWANMTCPLPHAPANCVPSLDHAMLNTLPVLGFSRACDHWKVNYVCLNFHTISSPIKLQSQNWNGYNYVKLISLWIIYQLLAMN